MLLITQFTVIIKYVHDDLISYLDFFQNYEGIFSSRTFKFDTSVVVSITFDMNSWIRNYKIVLT